MVHARHRIGSVRCDGQADRPAIRVVPQHSILEIKRSCSPALVDYRAIIGRKRNCKGRAFERRVQMRVPVLLKRKRVPLFVRPWFSSATAKYLPSGEMAAP